MFLLRVICSCQTLSGEKSELSELIVPGVNGILVPPADAEAIANAVAELVADPEKCKQFAIRGREKVEQAFDLQQETRKLKACFDAHSQP